MQDKGNPVGNRDLTDDQKQRLLALFDECDMCELLLTVAGIVGHRVQGYGHSLNAKKAIMSARTIARKGGYQYSRKNT